MASLNELKEALLQTLAAKGSLGQIKARIRSEIFSALDSADDDAANKPPLSNTNLLINELIREYLAFNQYRYSLNVFLPESNQPEVPPFDRAFISRELHVQENTHSVQIPLLYSIIALLQQNKVGEVASAGVPIIEPSTDAVPLSSSLAASSISSQQPGGQPTHSQLYAQAAQPSQPQQPLSHRSTTSQPTQQQHALDGFQDAPRPMHFVNRS